MHIIMFDRQSIFIHGMKISLEERIPGVIIQGVSQADELWKKLEENHEVLLMLDGDLDGEFCRWLLQTLSERFPKVKALISATDCSKKWLHEMVQYNVLAVVPRDSEPEKFKLALNSVAMGMLFLPAEWLTTPQPEFRDINTLSARQREILTMLAAGESNKEIGRALNISTGTVKAHLESLYRRLDVKNRTQAAMLLFQP
ncbi:response regulator transcription factor [Citrobacter rodentium]|uniref:Transcriptional regulator n=2 Tax=Citrobacter rodentium TaxID=67825 RepID=D2TKM6_CITRI|nr:response regulator transcription factor [Citrobacter rodentium]KIQ51865.1 LuxR family transcriptional regulator [Citrobacter rodentium]QBY30569.1 response regulator transcription factor [Citrobacter rodentium]UHO32060.1 response regulator transcription factor [Citrobacter rodentium NBRC 105723 = DSM 16636]CBG90987.1 transcriptional regulator [Citrobacter rodentium ICC168]HAT8011382.1 DNA-binding response regulator [Citrobacter rodentium NBRC 105723 = DSM 16636]